MNTLPIDSLLPDLRDALSAHHEVVLEAPPGAGKTTRVPLALLDAPWLAGQKILMLEPRRLAARADVLVLRALDDGAVLFEDPPLHLDRPAAGGGPLLVARGGAGGGSLRRLASRGLSHGRPPGEVSDWFRAALGKGDRGGGGIN